MGKREDGKFACRLTELIHISDQPASELREGSNYWGGKEGGLLPGFD